MQSILEGMIRDKFKKQWTAANTLSEPISEGYRLSKELPSASQPRKAAVDAPNIVEVTPQPLLTSPGWKLLLSSPLLASESYLKAPGALTGASAFQEPDSRPLPWNTASASLQKISALDQ